MSQKKLDGDLLLEFENLVAGGKNDILLQRLLAVKEETAYKPEILQLSSRWKQLKREQMNGTLSSSEQNLQNSRFNKALLLLLEGMRNEFNGDKVEKNLLAGFSSAAVHTYRPFWQTYLPVMLAGLAVWGMSYFHYYQSPVNCDTDINLHGQWGIFSNIPDQVSKKVGNVSIIHPNCELHFQMNGVLDTPVTIDEEVDFQSKLAGLKDKGEIYLIYENYNGEKGLCHGLVLNDGKNEFTLKCTDLIGYDRDGIEVSKFRFKRE